MCEMFQVNKSSSDFWNGLKITWQQCADLPYNRWVLSVVELNEKVYVTVMGSKIAHFDPLMYDCNKDQWSSLPALPYVHFSLVAVPNKKQLLAIGGMVTNNRVNEFTDKVFLWDKDNKKWTTPYPNMPTARSRCSSISHGSTVIVAGGVTCYEPWTMTRRVEVLHNVEHSLLINSYWSVVEQLPHVVCEAIPLIVDDQLYFAQGYDSKGPSSCNIVTASLSELLQSSNKNISSGQVWNKLPDMPYSSHSINHFHGRLIIFDGAYQVEQLDAHNPVFQSVPLIHIYNPDTRTWDCVGEIPHGYLLGRSILIRENKYLFIGGLTGTYDPNKDDDMMITCSVLTLSPW